MMPALKEDRGAVPKASVTSEGGDQAHGRSGRAQPAAVSSLRPDERARASRFEKWSEQVRATCGSSVRLSPLAGEFTHGTIRSGHLGAAQVSLIEAGAHRLVRGRLPTDRDDDGYLYMAAPESGRVELRQDGKSTVVTAGSIAGYDSSRPYTLS